MSWRRRISAGCAAQSRGGPVLSTITLFDGPVITEIDVLPASASRLLYGGREADAGSDGSAAPLSRSIEFVVYDALAQQIGGRKLTD
jgi:hypothetical protein